MRFVAYTHRMRDGPDLRASPRRTYNCPARLKALDPLTSTSPPTSAEVVEYSENGIKLRAPRDLIIGTLVQLHVERSFSLWKVRSCLKDGDAFLLGLEMAKPVHPVFDSIELFSKKSGLSHCTLIRPSR
jgi:hypothetical protein